MLDDERLNQYLKDKGVSDAGRAYIQRVRLSDPSRAVGSGARNVACRFASRKMGRTIQAESHTGELPALWIWEFDSATYEFWDQPEPTGVPMVRRDGRPTLQLKTADYLVLQKDYVGWVECKPRAWLEQRLRDGDVNYALEADGRWRYLPGEKAATPWGMGYVIRLAEDNNPVLVDNLKFLDDYLTDDAPVVPKAARDRIRGALAATGWARISDLLAEPDIEADHLYGLIARRDLHVRLTEDRLSESSRSHVFLDADTVELYRAVHSSPAASAVPDISLVDLSNGAKISWNGTVYQILNEGPDGFTLEAENHRVISLGKDAMYRLIGDGSILADPGAPDQRSERAAARLRSATEAERSQAVVRYKALFPSDGEPQPATPERTLTEWRRLYRHGEAVYGNGFLGLLPNTHLRGNRLPKLPVATREIVADVIREHYMTAEARSVNVVWALARERCEAAGTMPPSEATITRTIDRMFCEVELAHARHGRKAAYQVSPRIWRLDTDSPRHGQRPFEIAHLDHTEIDLQLVDTRFKRKVRKCWVSALIDAYSRVVLATYVTFDPPSYRSNMMVIRECVRRHHRVPAMLIVDWGSDFRSEYFEQLLAFLVVQKLHRPKGAPRHGTLIERLFRRANDGLIHQLRGNNKALQHPRGMSASHDPRELAVWTIETFTEWFGEYLDEVYAKQPHETLGVSPKEALDFGMREFGERGHRLIANDEAFRMMTLPAAGNGGRVAIRSGSFVRINGICYSAPALAGPGMLGKAVNVRYDPFNVGHAYAYVGGAWIELLSEYAATFSRYTEREIAAASEEIRERFKGIYANRAVSAKILAHFLNRVEEVEAKLGAEADERKAREQALSDLQSVDARARPRLIASQARPSDDTADAEDEFEDLQEVDYGDAA